MFEHFHAVLAQLWANWVFRLSLSNNELFHSNTLQYFAELLADEAPAAAPAQAPPLADAVDEAAPPGADAAARAPQVISRAAAERFLALMAAAAGAQTHAAVMRAAQTINLHAGQFRVEREWHHLDLALLCDDGRPIFGIEVKVKSYPTRDQVLGYLAELGSAGGEDDPPLFLLAGMGAAEATTGLPRALGLDFGQLAGQLGLLHFHLPSAEMLRQEYRALCAAQHTFYGLLQAEFHQETTLSSLALLSEQLRPYRQHAVMWKLWAAFLAQRCRTRIAETGALEGARADWLHTDSAYTRTGNVEVGWRTPEKKGEKNGEKKGAKKWAGACMGVQVEGLTLRLFFRVTSGAIAGLDRRRVERALMQLTAEHGAFARNPAIRAYGETWRSSGKDYSNPDPELSEADIDGDTPWLHATGGAPRTSGFVPRLHGYNNGAGNAFADYRLGIDGGVTTEQLSELIADVLVGDRFSAAAAPDAGTPLLLRIVQGFEESDAWMCKPQLAP